MKKYTPTALLFLVNLHPAMATESITFDDEFLKSRGIDTSIAKQFAQAPAFLPGQQELKIYVNNQYRASVNVNINQDGQPCINAALLEAIGINDPRTFQGTQTCIALQQLWENSDIVPKPAKQELWFFVPERAVTTNFNQQKSYVYGGTGAIVNYAANYMGSSGAGNRDMYYVNTEAGFNYQNWLFRSYQIYNHFTDSEFIHQYAYAQTTLEKQKKTLQLGQINLNNSVIGASRVIGLQLFPENQLENHRGGGALVTGVAAESSMVEIYQAGRLLYNTAVPAGPFELSQFSLVNQTADLLVKLKGVNGQEQQFIVPASTFSNNSPFSHTGYSMGIGRYDENNTPHKPLVASLSKGWGVNRYLGLQTGTVVSPDYYAVGLNSAVRLNESWRLSANTDVARDEKHHKTGGLFTGSMAYLASDTLSIGVNALMQSPDYHYLSDAVRDDQRVNNKQKQFGGDINWSTGWGTLGSSVGRTYTQDNQSQDYVSFSWSQTLYKNTILNTSYQRTYNIDNVYEDTFYLRLSIPLERANISAWLTRTDNKDRWGTRYNNYESHDRNWGIAYDYSDQKHYQSVSANAHTVTQYSQLGANIRRDNQHQTSWGASLNGGIAMVNEGVLLSPYEIKDTFGIAKAGDRRYVRLDTGAGPTWTNGNGYAVIPNLNAYQQNAVKVDPRSLSRQSDILNAYKTTLPAKGSIVPMTFLVIESRRVRVNTRLAGRPLPVDSVIRDEAGNFLTLATQSGQFFLGQATPAMKLLIETPEKQTCVVQLHLPDEPESQILYEEVNASCQ